MNLVTSIRQQMTQMRDWYINALITNCVLDYLDEETPDVQKNVEKIQEFIEDGVVKSELHQKMLVVKVHDNPILEIPSDSPEYTAAKTSEDNCRFTMTFRWRVLYTEKYNGEKSTLDPTPSNESNLIDITTKLPKGDK